MKYPLYKVFCGLGYPKGTTVIVKFTGQNKGVRITHPDKERLTGLEEDDFAPHNDQEYWRDPETIEEWLMCLPAPYGEIAVKAMGRTSNRQARIDIFLKSSNRSPARAVMDAICWADSEEGVGFWSAIHSGKLPEIPVKTKEEKPAKENRFATETVKGFNEVCYNLLEKKGYKVVVSTLEKFDKDYFCIRFEEKAAFPFSYSGTPEAYRAVSLAEMIDLIEKLPEIKQKTPKLIGELDEGTVIVFDDHLVKLGCQTLSKEDFAALLKTIDGFRNRRESVKATADYSIILGLNGVEIPGLEYTVSYDKIDFLAAEFEKYHK